MSWDPETLAAIDAEGEIDAAYRAKYGTGSPVRSITSPTATPTTQRVDPA